MAGPVAGGSGGLGAGQGRVEPGPVATAHALLSSGPDGSGLRLDKVRGEGGGLVGGGAYLGQGFRVGAVRGRKACD